MGIIIKRWAPFIFCLIAGIAVLLGYLFSDSVELVYFRDQLIQWAVIIAAFAFLLGAFNILRVHSEHVFRRRRGRYASFFLLLAMLIAIVPPLLPDGLPFQEESNRFVFNYLIGPLGASLAALVASTLILAAFRLLRARRSAGAVLFFAIVVVALLLSTPLLGLEGLTFIRDWAVNVWGMAGMRGLLLGVALGTIIMALRVLIGSERPYSES